MPVILTLSEVEGEESLYFARSATHFGCGVLCLAHGNTNLDAVKPKTHLSKAKSTTSMCRIISTNLLNWICDEKTKTPALTGAFLLTTINLERSSSGKNHEINTLRIPNSPTP
ncbi:MAG TPA: hypothetical protein VIX90_05005 [Edaphobacter sp.]